MSLLNQKQYARHRGVNPSYISALKNKGLLDGALVKIPRKKYPKIDSDKADWLLDFTFADGLDLGELARGSEEVMAQFQENPLSEAEFRDTGKGGDK